MASHSLARRLNAQRLLQKFLKCYRVLYNIVLRALMGPNGLNHITVEQPWVKIRVDDLFSGSIQVCRNFFSLTQILSN